MYTYPIRPTGTAQDLMGIVTRAGESAIAREGTVLPRKTEWGRALWEPPCNLGGMLTRMLFELLPADLALDLHDAVYRNLAGGRSYPFDAAAPALSRAAAEARAIEAETGRAPALVALLSHPPVLGELGHLNFELVRHASLALRLVRGRPCRPRTVAAVDPFALDTVGLCAEGFYAGFMGLYHLGLDRLGLGRGRLSALIVGEAAWPRLAPRLLRRLAGGQEVVMALSGGVPATARILYTVREWVAAQRRRSPRRGDPAAVLRRLRDWDDFRRFEALGPQGAGLRRCAWRLMEGWAMSAVAGNPWNGATSAPAAAETGILAPGDRATLGRCLEALGISEAQSASALAELSREWSRETPLRRRLFRVLAGRILARGRPVLFVPVVHGRGERPGVQVGDAWSWRRAAAGASGTPDTAGADLIQGRVLGEPPRDWQGTAEEFAVEFGETHYA